MTSDRMAWYAARLHMRPDKPDATGWVQSHVEAVTRPRGPEGPIVSLLHGWLYYADSHRDRYGSGIGEDGVLGDDWEAIGHAIAGLLNGECGRLDCGTLDGLIRDVLAAEGFDRDW